MSVERGGKTFRKIADHSHQNPLLTVQAKSLKRQYVDLFDKRYWTSVSYSMKKKNRWMLSTLLTKDFYSLDEVIIYKERQSLFSDVPYITGYLFDSLTGKEFGSQINTDRKLINVFINEDSIIHSIENEHNHTAREITRFEKSKYKQKKSKKSRKQHRLVQSYIPRPEESLPPTKEYLSDVENRKDCIYINTNVHINDFSKVNSFKTIHKKRRQISEKYKRNSKKIKSSLNFDFFDDMDDSNGNESENENENENEINTSENLHKDEFTLSTQPITLSKSDFLLKNLKQKKKKKISKKSFYFNNFNKTLKKELFEKSNENDEKMEFFVDFKRDILPFISIHLPYHVFVDDLETILNICNCWFSNTFPVSILIGLSNVLATSTESYLVLKPTFSEDSENISLKILFNMFNLNYGKLLDKFFPNVREVLKALQETDKLEEEKISINSKVMILEKPFDGLNGIWSTKPIENEKDFFKYHDEWRKNVFSSKDIETVLNKIFKHETEIIETCEICYTEVCFEDLITLNECNHKICEECLSSHLIYRLETGMKILSCPGVQCKTEFDCAAILQSVSFKRYRKRLKLLETNVIQKKGAQCIECGTITMMKEIESEEPHKRLEYKCLCGKILCNLCGKTQHWPSSCYEYRKHDQKLKMLKDIEIFTERRQPLIFNGINCPKCMFFVIKITGCDHMSCNCGADFCWLCGDANDEGIHVIDGFPCYTIPEDKHLTFDLTYITPGSSEIRPKLYIRSLSQRLNNFEDKRRKLFYHINLMFGNKWKFEMPDFNVKQLEDQFKNLLIVTENIFVKAYQLDKRKQFSLQNYLKSSACILSFYQNQIKETLETISYLVKQSLKNHCHRKHQIKENLEKLNSSMIGVGQFINRLHLIL